MKSKYCEVGAFISHHPPTVCGLTIEANTESIKLKEDVDKWLPTSITFGNFKGFRVFAATITRYTLSVCLIKDKED